MSNEEIYPFFHGQRPPTLEEIARKLPRQLHAEARPDGLALICPDCGEEMRIVYIPDEHRCVGLHAGVELCGATVGAEEVEINTLTGERRPHQAERDINDDVDFLRCGGVLAVLPELQWQVRGYHHHRRECRCWTPEQKACARQERARAEAEGREPDYERAERERLGQPAPATVTSAPGKIEPTSFEALLAELEQDRKADKQRRKGKGK